MLFRLSFLPFYIYMFLFKKNLNPDLLINDIFFIQIWDCLTRDRDWFDIQDEIINTKLDTLAHEGVIPKIISNHLADKFILWEIKIRNQMIRKQKICEIIECLNWQYPDAIRPVK